MVDSQVPCRKESKIQVLTTFFRLMPDCMSHCEKLGGGSPPVRTLQVLQLVHAELGAATDDVSVLPWLWVRSKRQNGGITTQRRFLVSTLSLGIRVMMRSLEI